MAERSVALRGYRPRGSTDLLGVALVLGTAAAAIVFFASPLGRALTWLERWTGRSGPRRGRDAVAWMATSAHALLGGKGDPVAELWPTLAVLGTSALIAAAPFARSLVGVGPDVGTGLVLATTLAVALALTSGRKKEKQAWSFRESVRLAGWTLSHHLPALAAVACAVALTGSLSMSDLVAAQGGEPWHWLAVRSPAGPLMLALTLWPVMLEIRGPRVALPDAITDAPRTDDGAVLPPAAWAATLLLSSVASAAWLGGWALPFVDMAAQGRSFPLTALGAIFFLAKTWALALAMATLRAVLPRFRLDQTGRPLVSIGAPAALAGIAVTAGWIAWDPAPIVRRGVAAVLCGLTLLLIVHALRRMAGATRGAAQPQVSPFLLATHATG
jgi:NADH-quinone oxidoreductase subunit H